MRLAKPTPPENPPPPNDDHPPAEVGGGAPRRHSPEDDDGQSAEGAWLELSVLADLEAVEAVSEILSRVAHGGTRVKPGCELIDEGLGARLDPSRPAMVRAYLPARDRSLARASVREARTALGHLQA